MAVAGERFDKKVAQEAIVASKLASGRTLTTVANGNSVFMSGQFRGGLCLLSRAGSLTLCSRTIAAGLTWMNCAQLQPATVLPSQQQILIVMVMLKIFSN